MSSHGAQRRQAYRKRRQRREREQREEQRLAEMRAESERRESERQAQAAMRQQEPALQAALTMATEPLVAGAERVSSTHEPRFRQIRGGLLSIALPYLLGMSSGLRLVQIDAMRVQEQESLERFAIAMAAMGVAIGRGLIDAGRRDEELVRLLAECILTWQRRHTLSEILHSQIAYKT